MIRSGMIKCLANMGPKTNSSQMDTTTTEHVPGKKKMGNVHFGSQASGIK